MSNALLFTMI